MSQRLATPTWKPLHRLTAQGSNYGLAAGKTFANTNVRYEAICCAGMSKITVRVKTSGAGGTLDIFFVGPDVDVGAALQGDIAYASLTGTIYTSGNATQGTIVAGTELLVSVSTGGEDYAIVKLTGTGSGTITYVDVATLGVGFQ